MQNFLLRIDLKKLNGAFLTEIRGREATKTCLVIPTKDAGLFVGTKGVYLDLAALEVKDRKFDDTHCLKLSVSRERYEAMTDEEKRLVPIVGGMRPAAAAQQTVTDFAQQGMEVPAGDLPF